MWKATAGSLVLRPELLPYALQIPPRDGHPAFGYIPRLAFGYERTSTSKIVVLHGTLVKDTEECQRHTSTRTFTEGQRVACFSMISQLCNRTGPIWRIMIRRKTTRSTTRGTLTAKGHSSACVTPRNRILTSSRSSLTAFT
jgi:hypothetical protein